MKLRSVKTYPADNCCNCLMWFPQFRRVDKEKFYSRLKKTLDNPDPYFVSNYPDYKEQLEVFKQMQEAASLIEACAIAVAYPKRLWLSNDYWLGLDECTVLEYIPCCR